MLGQRPRGVRLMSMNFRRESPAMFSAYLCPEVPMANTVDRLYSSRPKFLQSQGRKHWDFLLYHSPPTVLCAQPCGFHSLLSVKGSRLIIEMPVFGVPGVLGVLGVVDAVSAGLPASLLFADVRKRLQISRSRFRIASEQKQ